MIRDYPDVVPGSVSSMPANLTGTPASSVASSPASSVLNLPYLSPPATPTVANSSHLQSIALPAANRSSVLPPPRHPSVALQTTYTPYVPRRGRAAATPVTNPLSPSGQHIPIITSSSQGGVTTRHPVPANASNHQSAPHHDAGPSAALLDKVRALDSLPRLGALRTLDLKGNDLRVSNFSFQKQLYPDFSRRASHILRKS